MGRGRIVIAGDGCRDILIRPIPPMHRGGLDRSGTAVRNWELRPGQLSYELEGGAALLGGLVKAAVGSDVDVVVGTPDRGAQPSSIVVIAPSQGVLRVKRILGFEAPANPSRTESKWQGSDSGADIVVLDDPGNGFRFDEKQWPPILKDSQSEPIVILKTSRPLADSPLWECLKEHHLNRLIVIVDAEDLREEGANINKGLSWERTAMDCVWALDKGARLREFTQCPHTIVRFGLDGALYRNFSNGDSNCTLYYDPKGIEGDYSKSVPGKMVGLNSAFAAAITKHVYESGIAAIGEGIPSSILSARSMLACGFGHANTKNPGEEAPNYPTHRIFQYEEGGKDQATGLIASVPIRKPAESNATQANRWSICDDQCGSHLSRIALELVTDGVPRELATVPAAEFGGLNTIDRREIESFRAIRTLLQEYIDTPTPPRPLCIAVFGAPGSGKSFGVKQVAKSFPKGTIATSGLTFNVSQFESPGDIAKSLHKVRDVALTGQVPLVFFDEFDSSHGDQALGWLKYFLMPMQDGEFKDGEAIHPVGKAIFVFAGGTSSTYEEFAAGRNFKISASGEDAAAADRQFKDVKGPDFLSRLRGFVNIAGPNPVGTDNQAILRRAKLIRPFIERGAPNILDGARARIDEHLVYALLHVSRYRHGIRSIEAIFDMSRLAGLEQFQRAALPPQSQLDMHVPAQEFLEILHLGPALNTIAEQIHANYIRRHKDRKSADDPAMSSWEKLAENVRESNRQQAAHIPLKLRHIAKGFVPNPGTFRNEEFDVDTVEKLAILEHDRWMAERIMDGWRYAAQRDHARKRSPYLVSWDELAKLEGNPQEWDREAVRDIPEILQNAGWQIIDLPDE